LSKISSAFIAADLFLSTLKPKTRLIVLVVL
jgi:hypothetical protein